MAVNWGKIETLQKVWECPKKITREELNKLLLGTVIKGRTAWRLAVTSVISKTLQIVWQCAKEKLRTEELNKFL
jgi:hypothetical protein